MAEIFSIAKQLDVEKLNEKIAYFVYENGHNPYIFANTETLAVLIKAIERDDKKITEFADAGFLEIYQSKGLIVMYQGYRMLEDSSLDFGEIELR